MQRDTGDIYLSEAAQKRRITNLGKLMMSMEVPPTVAQLEATPVDPNAQGRVGRNQPCPCGSGQKFKRCCLVVSA